jgi:hypothetical protein
MIILRGLKESARRVRGECPLRPRASDESDMRIAQAAFGYRATAASR